MPADYLSKPSRNSNNEPEYFLARNEAREAFYKEDLRAMFNFLQLKTGNLEQNVLSWVKRNIRNFLVSENQMFICTSYELCRIATLPSPRLLMRTLVGI